VNSPNLASWGFEQKTIPLSSRQGVCSGGLLTAAPTLFSRRQSERDSGGYSGFSSDTGATAAGQRRTLTGFPSTSLLPGNRHPNRYLFGLSQVYH